MPTTAKGCIERANLALDMAKAEPDPEGRETFLKLAETWLRMAEEHLQANSTSEPVEAG